MCETLRTDAFFFDLLGDNGVYGIKASGDNIKCNRNNLSQDVIFLIN